MSQPYTCPECGYYTAFGNAARIALHVNVSHAGNGEIAADPWLRGLVFDTTQVNRSKHARRARSGRIKP